ncbi:hypothetical protein ACLVWU_10875 [Bdellovibrio sp. HCB290]|uniref:hypothetical protein n=1 Tax=Bdellovibrio sp. HCB290 TaxID=3394356 RepID=UPI0039B63BC9
MKTVASVLFILSLGPIAHAQDGGMASAYSFGGACAAQGIWTQSALSATQNLRKVTLQLKDDPNCKALGNSVQSAIQNMENSIQGASDTPSRVSRLSQLPQEINALRSFLNSAPDMKQQILRTMMDRSIESATLGAQVSQDSANMSVVNSTAQSMGDFGTRLQRSTQTGLSMLNQVVDSIPQLDQCLTGDGQAVLGNVISSAVKIASSFASSGQDLTGSQIATTISKLTNLTRERKYTAVLRKLNQQEFLSSMACLMEVTSESYCQARDGMNLFQKGMKDLTIQKSKSSDLSAGNPFVGYYVLNTHVPNITKWLQKIQIGVDPKLPTDATFQNKILQEVVDFQKGVKTLLGDFNTGVETIRKMENLQAKQNAVLKLLTQTTGSMVGQQGFGRNDDVMNFFLMSTNAMKIPFALLGMGVPDNVSGKAMPLMSYSEWLQANMETMPIFQDPVALTETIGKNMQEIIRVANISAIEYFNRWYIVDKAALVNESTIDINYTVQDSLKAINQYLEAEKGRIAKYNGNLNIVPTILDTQMRIGKILKAYENLEAIGKNALIDRKNINQTQESLQETAEAYEKLVTTVYEQFNVMLSRSGFLANRMVNFVYQDYIMLLNNKVDFTPYQEDLFSASGMAMMDKMLAMYNGNPSNIQTDLNMALRINKGNLEALDGLIKDNVIGTISNLKQIENGESAGFFTRMDRMLGDSSEDWVATAKDKNPTTRKVLKFLHKYSLTNLIGSYFYGSKHSDRYGSEVDVTTAPQSEFDDAENVRAQLCIQALAFNNQNGLRELCNGVVLKTPLPEKLKGMNVAYNQKLTAYQNDKSLNAQKKQAFNHSDRICAFRDYNIRNMAVFMSLNQNKK